MASASTTMPPIQAPSNLPDLVRAAFERAKASGALTYYPTQVALLNVNSLPFQLRFSPALVYKPKPPKPSGEEKPFNPFAAPPAALTIAPLPPAHVLLLNRFAVVPEHFLLVTRAFAPQTHLLGADDLAATYACIRAYPEGDGLFAFFNSGVHSGASQPHRHVQLLPVARMRDGLGEEEGRKWHVLADGLVDEETRGKLPFEAFAERLDRNGSGARLLEVYLRLYGRACKAMGVEGEGVEADGEASICYNMAMTRDVMVVCPRAAEGAEVRDGDVRAVGKLSLNGTVLAGTALVKSEAEWDALRGNGVQVGSVLGRIGVARGRGRL